MKAGTMNTAIRYRECSSPLQDGGTDGSPVCLCAGFSCTAASGRKIMYERMPDKNREPVTDPVRNCSAGAIPYRYRSNDSHAYVVTQSTIKYA